MAQYTGSQLGITPATGVANWILQAASGVGGFIKEVVYGGEVTTSTAMRTRIARDSALGTGSATAGNVQKGSSHSPSNGVAFNTTYATTQPTIVAGSLWATSWNAHGGVVRMLVDPSEIFDVYDAGAASSSIECRQDIGTATSSFVLVWLEW
jgi:hypothetical protein